MTPWFGPKGRYDFGIASWQGWLATLLFLICLAADRILFQPATLNLPVWTKSVSTGALTFAFLALIWARYDRDL